MRIILTLVFIGSALAPPAIEAEAAGAQQSKASSARSTPRPPSRWWSSEKYRQELKLSTEQSAEIERIVQSTMARLKGDKDDLDRAQSDFRQLMEQAKAPERELLKAAERLEMTRYLINKERTTMLVRIHSVLTPEQRKGLEVIAKRHDDDRNRSR